MAVTLFGPGSLSVPFAATETPKKKEGDAFFPASDFAYVPDRSSPSTWKLRLTSTPGSKPDPRIVGAAVAALGKGFRGQRVQIPAKDMPGVKRRVLKAWRSANPDAKPGDVPPVLKGLDAMADLDGVAPPGWKHSVEKMKKHKDIDNPFAIAWFLKKRGAKPHREDAEADPVFDAEVQAALTVLHAQELPLLFTAAAQGQAWAHSLLLDASAAMLTVERRF